MEPLHVSELLPPKESFCVLTAIDDVGKDFSKHLRLTLSAPEEAISMSRTTEKTKRTFT